ncbi:UNVERIFIED_CONTAM: hypothetical protein RMT77_006773 [Armadillidium vulgare]
MGRKRSVSESSGHEFDNSDDYACSSISNHESPSRKKVKRKHKKSHKYMMMESELIENEYYRKHKNKHKKHRREASKHREHFVEHESYKHLKKKHSHRSSRHESNRHKKYSDSDRSRHSSHSRKEKHRHSKDLLNQELKHETEEPKSRWADDDNETNLLQPIKTEPVSDDDTLMSEINNSENHKISNIKEDKQRKDDREKWENNIPEKVKEEKPEVKEKVNMGLSGKLTEDTNTYNGVVIKYSQPPEARKPKRRWRWYIFKGDEELPFLPLHRQSAYLIGRERKVADIPTDHPSCSKQHAVFQYRLVSYERRDGSTGRTVKPYILDLESANGTYVNNRRIDPRCYVELLEKDVVKFGYSSREYVLLHEASKGSDDELPDAGVADGMDLSPISLLRSQ